MPLKDFQVLAKLGEGSYSCVYKVRRITDNQEYALKRVKLSKLSDKEKQNALDEVRILASITNENLIAYKEAFIDESSSSLCIVVEFADNGDLFQRLTELSKREGHMPETEIWNIFGQIVKGLKALHDLQICHRDLKSANIFLKKDGTAKIGDMNVSKVAKQGFLHTQTGTPYYASPEVWRDQPYDMKSDIWSLGCVLYEMAANKPPFQADDVDGLYKKILRGLYPRLPSFYSQELSNMIRSLLQKSPSLRPNCDKILVMLATLKKINDKYNNDEFEKNVLLSTILFPKNLNSKAVRLPKSNYTPIRQRKRFTYTIPENRNNSMDAMIAPGSDSFDRGDPLGRQGVVRIGRGGEYSILPSSRGDSIEVPDRHYVAQDKQRHKSLRKHSEDLGDNYNPAIDNEIIRLKKQLEARCQKDEDDRKRLDQLLREKEVRERELYSYVISGKDSKATKSPDNTSYDEGNVRNIKMNGYTNTPNNMSIKSIDPDESLEIGYSKGTEKYIPNPVYNPRPSKRLGVGNSPFRNQGNKNRVGLHALARNMNERVGDQYQIPDIDDLPKPKLSKLPPVSITKILPQEIAQMSYGKQRPSNILRANKPDSVRKDGNYSIESIDDVVKVGSQQRL